MITLGIDLSTRKTGLALLCTANDRGEFPEFDLPGSQMLRCRWQQFMFYGGLALRGNGSLVDQTEDILLPVLAWAEHVHQVMIVGYAYSANQQYKDANVELGGVVRYSLRKMGL